MTRVLHITDHAVDRYIERVDSTATRLEARFALERFLVLGRSRSVPRHWMRATTRACIGTRYHYCAERPSMCAIVVDDVVVTVVTRALYAASRLPGPRRLRIVSGQGQSRIPSAADRARARWRWDGLLEEDAA